MTNSEQTTAASTKAPLPETPSPKSMLLGEAGKKENDTEDIYLDLDVILDTRLGTLATLGDEHAVSALNSGVYHKRGIDEYVGITIEAFKAAYAKRDIDTLKRSVLTNMVFFLRRLIKDSLLTAVIQQKVEKMCFTINVYPYDFSDPDLVEMLIGCIRFHTYSASSVRIVSIPNEDLTPEFCVQSFQIMIRYDWVSWIDKHREFFEKKGIPGMTVIVPEIFYDAIPDQDDIDRLDLKKKNPFRMTETITAPLFRLKHMPISLFSIHEQITKENAAEMTARANITQQDIEDYLNKNYPKATLIHDNPLPDVDLSESFDLL